MNDDFTTPQAHLTALFQRCAANRTLDMRDITISVETDDHAEIVVKPRTPAQAARYLRYLFNTRDPMFQRGDMTLMDKTVFPSPITFRVGGTTYVPDTNLHFNVQMMRMRFFQTDRPSELCFDFNFCRTDWDNHHSSFAGPQAFDFIRTLEKAGQSWHNMFQDSSESPKRVPAKNHLRLVK